jgi:hypothetical protein
MLGSWQLLSLNVSVVLPNLLIFSGFWPGCCNPEWHMGRFIIPLLQTLEVAIFFCP